jgi:hypothetical protein
MPKVNHVRRRRQSAAEMAESVTYSPIRHSPKVPDEGLAEVGSRRGFASVEAERAP